MGKPNAKESNLQTVLGLAIGSNSVGWGLLEFDRKGPTRTLGEYLAKSDPVNERRIRDRWTGRKMYEHEFERIWAAQQTHHPGILMDELRGKLHFAIFFQRPLKSQKGLVGKCDLEPQHRRMALALLPAQRFRLLQRVNDLKICFEDGSEPGCLTSEQRSALLDALDTEGELTFGKARTAIGLKRTGTKFNLEEGGEKRLIGNRTGAKLRGVFGERWDRFTDQHRSQILSEVLGVHKEETMARRGREVWELDAEDAEELASVRLEEGYCAHSKEALKKILPLMEQGAARGAPTGVGRVGRDVVYIVDMFRDTSENLEIRKTREKESARFWTGIWRASPIDTEMRSRRSSSCPGPQAQRPRRVGDY